MNNCYVYGLFDPDTDHIFYVGKGSGYRDRSHLKPSVWKNPKETNNPFLYYKIRSLMEENKEPLVKRIKDGITEEESYQLENELIKIYGRRFSEEGGILFNISNYKGGNKKGITMPWSEERIRKHQNFCKEKRKYDPTYEELYFDYITMNMERNEISKKYEVSTSLVKKRLEYFGIYKPAKLRYPMRNNFICKTCGKEYTKPNSVKNSLYCTKKCYRT